MATVLPKGKAWFWAAMWPHIRFLREKHGFKAAMWPQHTFSEGKSVVLGQPRSHSARFPKEKAWFSASMCKSNEKPYVCCTAREAAAQSYLE